MQYTLNFMASSTKTITFQDTLQVAIRYVKYWKTALLLVAFGISAANLYLAYGKPGFYSRSLVSFTDLYSPIRSESSEVTGSGRWPAQDGSSVIPEFKMAGGADGKPAWACFGARAV